MLQKPLLHLLFTFFLLCRLPAATVASLPADAVALLAFKSNADLGNKLLYTTNERFDFCQWRGVKCAQGRVVRFVVQSFGLRGTISASTLTRLDQLRVLSLKNNSLFGQLPDFSPLVNLKALFLDHNYFSGEFPSSLLFLHRLLILDLSHNNFTGSLPGNLTALDRLAYLRLDSNRFSGAVPPLNQTTLTLLNISNNNLSGPIPVTPTLKKFKISSFTYNPNLCGEIINKPCRGYPFFNSSSGGAASSPTPLLQNAQSQQGMSDISHPSEKKHHKIAGLVLGLLTGTLILMAAAWSLVALIRKKREEEGEIAEMQSKAEANSAEKNTKAPSVLSLQAQTTNSESSEGKKPPQTKAIKSANPVFCSGEEELYTLEQLMRASAELLGRGTIGTAYKAVMANQLIVSVKRLDACKTAITSGEAFEQHMECVGVLRHPNLVPVRAYFQAKQERLVIFDYHPNGSLFNLIHVEFGAVEKPRQQKRKRAPVAGRKASSSASSERTEDALQSPPIRGVPLRSLMIPEGTESLQDDDLVLMGERVGSRGRGVDHGSNSPNSLSQRAELVIGDLALEHRKLARELNQERATRLEAESRAAAAEERAREAERLADEAKNDASLARAETKHKVAAEKKKLSSFKAEVASSQKEVLSAFAERIFFSRKFSGLAASLASVLNTQVRAKVINTISQDYPDLDKSKYGYEEVSKDALLHEYVEVLSDRWSELSLVKHLISQDSVLTAEDIRLCSVDRDEIVDALVASFAAEDELGEDAPFATGVPSTSEGSTNAEAEAGNTCNTPYFY